jgi:threonine/homoserine/homoserine lactone efflux protein
MSLELWSAFALASAVVIAIPGPTVLLVCAYALGAGRATALWTAAGVAAGDCVAMTASMLGLGAILAASGTLFTALKLAGAAYLVFLGVRLWRSTGALGPVAGRTAAATGPAMAAHAFAVTATNPKSIVFFVAFAPLFVDAAAPLAPQAVAMVATFTALGAINAILWALLAGGLRTRLARPRTLRWINRGGGAALVGMGAAAAFAGRG